jgi:hypothetical protein
MAQDKTRDTSAPLSLRGDRDLWLDFTHKVRKKKGKVWDIIEPMIKDYMKKK